MIRRVKIQGYKSLKDVEIELKPLTVVFGPNAAGKSNLFDALALISRIVTEKNLAEAFKDHRGAAVEAFYYGDEGLEALRTKETASFAIQVDVDLSDHVKESVEKRIRQLRERFRVSEEGERPKRRVTKASLRYEIGVEIAPSSGYLQVLNERLSALKKDRSEAKVPLPFIYKDEAGRKLRLRLEGQASRPTEHDTGLDYALISTPLYAPHYPHATAFKEEVSQWRFYYLEPDAMRQPTTAQPLARLGRSGANLAAFYNYLKSRDPRHFDTVSHALHELVPRIDTLSVKPTGDGRLQLWVEEEGVEFSAGVISEGTLRVLGLLAITNPIEPVTVIGYEEPENGVHPRRLKLIADLLKNAAAYGRQIIVNTHSPIFPEYFDNDALVVCGKVGHDTVFQRFTSDGRLFRAQEIRKALDETSLSERILRGDFGG